MLCGSYNWHCVVFVGLLILQIKLIRIEALDSVTVLYRWVSGQQERR